MPNGRHRPGDLAGPEPFRPLVYRILQVTIEAIRAGLGQDRQHHGPVGLQRPVGEGDHCLDRHVVPSFPIGDEREAEFVHQRQQGLRVDGAVVLRDASPADRRQQPGIGKDKEGCFNPTTIMLGGVMRPVLETILSEVRLQVAANIVPGTAMPELRLSALGEFECSVGVACLAHHHAFDLSRIDLAEPDPALAASGRSLELLCIVSTFLGTNIFDAGSCVLTR